MQSHFSVSIRSLSLSLTHSLTLSLTPLLTCLFSLPFVHLFHPSLDCLFLRIQVYWVSGANDLCYWRLIFIFCSFSCSLPLLPSLSLSLSLPFHSTYFLLFLFFFS